MKARRILTTLAVGLGLVVALLGLLGRETSDRAQAAVNNDSNDNARLSPAVASQAQVESLSNPVPVNSITIDEDREGWEQAEPYNPDPPNDTGGIGSVDWITITLANDCDDLYVRYEVSSGLPFTSNAIRYNLLIDVDRNRNSGYIGGAAEYPIGADILVQGSSTFRFTGTTPISWGWRQINYYFADDKGLPDSRRDIEFKILISDLVLSRTGVTTGFNWVAVADNLNGPFDYYPDGGNAGETGDFYTYTFNYTSTTTSFPNPERGFSEATETHSDNYTPLDLATLQCYRENEGTTIVHRMFYLEDFVNSDISESYTTSMTQDFNTIRDAGLKTVVRFAYTADTLVSCDASKDWILTHTQQLSDVLRANSDVIAAVQAGFIGNWGEWWGSCHFPDLECGCSPGDPAWDDRRDVLFAVLDTLPVTRMVQLRTPRYKYNIFSDTVICSDCIPQVLTPVNESQAHTGIPIARTGHHNDCFLASPTDIGTYIYTPTEYVYLRDDTQYVVMGGETCNFTVAADYDPIRLECDTAKKELGQFHWSYLNLDWYEPVLRKWRDGGCFPEIEERLGYRFAFLELTFPDQVTVGQSLQFSLQITNEGYAAPYNPRAVELVLSHTNGLTHAFELYNPSDTIDYLKDPRFWLAGETYTPSYTITVPLTLPAGSYELFLNLPDPELRHRPEYAIRLAGCVWEPSRGYNKLRRSVTVIGHIYLPVVLKDE